MNQIAAFDIDDVVELINPRTALASIGQLSDICQDAKKARVRSFNQLNMSARRALGLGTTREELELDTLNEELEGSDERRPADLMMEDYRAVVSAILGRSVTARDRFSDDRLTHSDVRKAIETTELPHGTIASIADFYVAHNYQRAVLHSQLSARALAQSLRGVPIYETFLKGVKGCGVTIAGVLIRHIDISKARYPSSLWAFAGYDVVDGQGRSRRASHLVEREYITRDGEVATRRGLSFNPDVKTALFLLAEQFNRSPDSTYGKILRDYKHRMECHPKYGIAAQEEYAAAVVKPDYRPSAGHRHRMAMRAAIKRFLADLYNAWRPLEGLPVAPEYSEAKLGIVHRGGRTAEDTQSTAASQSCSDTHEDPASHWRPDTQGELASHHRADTQ